MPASRLSWSSVGAGPSWTTPASLAAARYFRTVSRDRPVPDAMLRWLFPACQRRTTSAIAILSTLPVRHHHSSLRSVAMVADKAPKGGLMTLVNWTDDPS